MAVSMNVLHLTNSFRPFFNDQVDALRQQGVDVTTLCVPGSHVATNEGVNQRSVMDYAKFYPRVLQEVAAPYDIIHANHGLTAPYALAQPRRPIVLTLWGSDLVSTIGPVSRAFAHGFDEVILPSSNMSSELSSSHHIIPFGINTDKFQPINQKEARDVVGWDYNQPVVLFPYPRSRDVKNYSLAEKAVSTMSVDAELRCLNNVDHDNVPLYMNAADAVIVTSHRETGPMVIKEAAACNTPVVSTDVGFASKTLANVANSYICSSVKEFATRLDEIMIDRCQSDGAKFSDEWSIWNMGKKITNLYESMLD